MKRTIFGGVAALAILASASANAVVSPPIGSSGGAGFASFIVAAGVIFLNDQYNGEIKCQSVSPALHYVATAGQANCVPLSAMPWSPPDVRPWSVQTVFPNWHN